MKRILTIIILAALTLSAESKKIMVGYNEQYRTISQAAKSAIPGDSIVVRKGMYQGNEVINGLKGTEGRWITIMAEFDGFTFLTGGGTALHLTDPAFVRIKGFVIAGQTGNGINIDDGGSFDTPATNVEITDCRFEELKATGNNDQLKLSGLTNFTVRNSLFINGSKGGSMIDMVGCHNGLIENNLFANGGSNSIQVKGGSSDVIISRNSFENGGERSVNIGGSTGTEFFRPHGAKFEATAIHVWSNIFKGSGAAVAFVGSNGCDVTNNTIIEPSMWVLRILQENNSAGMQKCSGNTFSNNLAIFSAPGRPVCNTGPNTLPGTFTFAGNVWCNPADQNWKGPDLPAADRHMMVIQDPGFADDDYNLRSDSKAAGAGVSTKLPVQDFSGKNFEKNRSAGALEVTRK